MLSEQDEDICRCGLAILETVCTEIVSGSVTVGTLKHLNTHKCQFNKLCDVVKEERGGSLLLYKTVSEALDKRLAEYNIFVDCFEKLQNVCGHLTGFGNG